jgi:2-polyprenyl-3-methyl-5-hydroxy-6-metoxy-1,4-benzoquinol methylase
MFKSRSDQKEIMDDLQGSGRDMDQALRELEIINHLLGGNKISINGLSKILKNKVDPEQTIKVADLGCGGGDMMKLMARWGRKKGIKLSLTGIDANPYIIDYARENTRNYPEINYQSINIFSKEFLDQEFDIIHCCLFTHHFSSEELKFLIKNFKKQVKLGMIINDLHRHWFAYYSIKVITALASKSAMVKNDGPVSVLRAFSKNDLENILNNSGVNKYSIKWKWAFRWQIIVLK